MTAFGAVFRLELLALLRHRLSWFVLAALFGALLVGALNGSNRVAEERATLAQLTADENRAVANAIAAARRYAQPSDLRIDWHRDPTDALGYMNYFLVTHAIKPPLPFAAVAAGQSDLQPFQIRVDFSAMFHDAAYDLGAPHALKLGAFDLAFVLVYLVPLSIIALGATRLTAEHDNGVLRLIAAQPTTPLLVASAKYAALGLAAVAAVVGGTLLALALVGELPITADTLLLSCVLAFWSLLWVSLCALVASLWRGVVVSIGLLVLAWTVAIVLLPAAATLAIDLLHPSPSRIAYIDASRSVADAFSESEGQIKANWLSRHPRFNTEAALASTEVRRLSRDAYYREALQSHRATFEAHAAATLAAGERLRFASPAMVLEGALQSLAGTDQRRHLTFLAAADAYTERLRRYFEPLALANAVNSVRTCPDCPGRLNFRAYNQVPDYTWPPEPAPGRGALWAALVYLALLSGLLSLLALRRLRTWPL